MARVYKYYAGLTSQLPFCSTPLRLDTYNKCQYGCAYCFASTRQGYGRNEKLQISNPASLENRLKSIGYRENFSSLDEFIERRIPFQLGGMSDPFIAMEKKESKSLQYINILKKYNYPFIISTKSNLLGEPEYLEAIAGSNVYVRFSITVISEKYRKIVDRGCPSVESLSALAMQLNEIGVPVAFRFQPIIPGFEEEAYRLIDMASLSRVKHISIEYLKVPIDANIKFSPQLQEILGSAPVGYYISLGAKKQGREYILPLTYRMRYLPDIYKYARESGLTVGFADNDLLIHSNGKSCCGAADLYLKDASFFDANIVSLAKEKEIGEKIYFKEFSKKWMPYNAISTYLNSKARLDIKNSEGLPEWMHYLRKMWVNEYSIFNPGYFDGVELDTKLDESQLPIYIRKESQFEKILKSTN